jgi:hypothetical protein
MLLAAKLDNYSQPGMQVQTWPVGASTLVSPVVAWAGGNIRQHDLKELKSDVEAIL